MEKKESVWLYCPVCNAKTKTKAYTDTVLIRYPLYCPRCRKEYSISLFQMKMLIEETDVQEKQT